MFALSQKYKDEQSDSMQGLVKLMMNSLYGVQIWKVINESFCCKSEHWMQTEYDETVLDYWKLPNGNYILRMKKDDGLDDNDCDIKNSLPARLRAFFLSNSNELCLILPEKKTDFNILTYTNITQLPIVCMWKKYWNVLDKANLVGKNLCQVKNDYKQVVFYGLFLAPKIK